MFRTLREVPRKVQLSITAFYNNKIHWQQLRYIKQHPKKTVSTAPTHKILSMYCCMYTIVSVHRNVRKKWVYRISAPNQRNQQKKGKKSQIEYARKMKKKKHTHTRKEDGWFDLAFFHCFATKREFLLSDWHIVYFSWITKLILIKLFCHKRKQHFKNMTG